MSLPAVQQGSCAVVALVAVREAMQALCFPWAHLLAQASVNLFSNVLHDMTLQKRPRSVDFLKQPRSCARSKQS